jgi:hypothetical protein
LDRNINKIELQPFYNLLMSAAKLDRRLSPRLRIDDRVDPRRSAAAGVADAMQCSIPLS